jgi:hypothetical protein
MTKEGTMQGYLLHFYIHGMARADRFSYTAEGKGVALNWAQSGSEVTE